MYLLGTTRTPDFIMLGMRISLELLPAEDDRLEGHVQTEDGVIDLTFSGTLDLLRAIEEIRRNDRGAGNAERIDLTTAPAEGDPEPC